MRRDTGAESTNHTITRYTGTIYVLRKINAMRRGTHAVLTVGSTAVVYSLQQQYKYEYEHDLYFIL